MPLLSNNLISLSEKTGKCLPTISVLVPKLPSDFRNCKTSSPTAGVRTMLLHSAKPGDSGTYRMTITNSSGTASCSASLSIRSESRILFVPIFTETHVPQERRPRTHRHQPHLTFLCRGVPTPVWAGPAPPPTLPRPAPTPPPTPPTTPPTPLAEALLLILPTDPTFRHSLLLQLLPQ